VEDSAYDARAYLGADWLGTPIDPLFDPWYRFGRLLHEIDASIAVRARARWLDLGCHQGQFAKLVAAKYGVESVGVDDWDPAMKGDPSWAYFQANLGAGFSVGDDYAYVSALEVLEHMIDTDAFLQRCGAHLIRGGHLILTTPNINSLRNRVTVPLGAYPVGLEHRNVIHHVRLYNMKLLGRQLAEHGFKVLWIKGVSFFPVRFLKRGLSLALDRESANRLPHLCANLMVLAQKE